MQMDIHVTMREEQSPTKEFQNQANDNDKKRIHIDERIQSQNGTRNERRGKKTIPQM